MRVGLVFTISVLILSTSCSKNRHQSNATLQSGAQTYRYAFSAQVLNALTNEVVTDFAVDMVGADKGISVINPLGDPNGIFHVSRNPSWNDQTFTTLPAVISAAGFESTVQNVDLGSDCQTIDCKGPKNLQVFLKPVSVVAANPAEISPEQLSLATVTQLMSTEGTPAIFNQLMNTGKLDPKAGDLLAKAKNKDMLTGVLVLLGTSGNNTRDQVSTLLKGLPTDSLKTDSIAALLPYLQPFSSGKGLRWSSSQLAMTSLMPVINTLVASKTATSPFDSILSNALKDPSLMSTIQGLGKPGTNGGGDQQIAALLNYVTPLLQGLTGKNAATLAPVFNDLVKTGGITAIKDLGTSGNTLNQFAALLPYLEPLIKGLSGKDAGNLTALLTPFINQKDPALALQSLLTKTNKGKKNANVAAVANVVFPALQTVMGQGVVAKQVFAAQLLQGLSNGDLKGLQVSQDLTGVSGVVLTGQARDIFKIVQLPNVEKVLVLSSKP